MSAFDWEDFFDDIGDDSESIISEKEAASPKAQRDREYTQLVHAYTEHYSKKSETNRLLKVIFFGFTLLLLGLLVLGCVAVAIVVCIFVNDQVAVLTTLVSSILGAVSSILILPTIICNYLFPKDEDKYIRDLIKHFKDTDNE